MNAMRFAETSPRTDRPAPRPALPGRRFTSIALSLLAAALSFTPLAVQADTPAGLPQGWTSDAPEEAAAPNTDRFQPTQAVDAQVSVTVSGDEYVDTDPAALSDFREPLAAYGTWVDDSTYGTVWVPSATVVGADFAPYQTAGRWELDTDSNWMWVSDYDWGYIPFHYGRWTWIGGRGWGWIPGRVYAPAWVTWRMTDYGYVGWAPMAPSWYWFGGSAVNVWVTPSSAFVFCPSSYVFHRHVHTYVVRDRDIVRRIGAHSRPYRPAQPTAGGGGAHARSSYRPASPSLAEAKIPSGAAPEKRSAPDARAAAYSRRSTTAQAKAMPAPSRGLVASPSVSRAQGGHAEGRGVHVDRSPRGDVSPREPRGGRGEVSTPSASPSRPAVSPSRPAVSSPKPSRPATESRPSASPSRPSTSPSRPSVSPSRPSVSPSRPSVSPSRPSVSPSRPSVSPSRPSVSPSRSSSPSRRGR
ncbi:DUF6600 domain-containing protein [Polyangium sorediatum]|uniref:Uncharacterized protein n=1 Tax=Polyangium sorediatum TaxID=889274 RepID=A0ABT6P3A9_9BACT|nr:DUF6600 domain-containing protein [Polyangium sorediatum]MDI1435097.1 hypothetical protein [Polyangium sorediatum]